MVTTRQLLQDLVQGTVSLEQVVADFQARAWPSAHTLTVLEMYGVVDLPLPSDDSIDWVDITPGLTDEQRAALREAYDQAVQ